MNISSDQWKSVDYLLTGDVSYIQHMLHSFLDSRNDPYDALSHRIRNLWVPHNYLTEYRRLTAKVMSSLYFKGVTHETLVGKEPLFDFFQHSFQSMLNYGGGMVVVTPPSKGRDAFSSHNIKGKAVTDVVMDVATKSLNLVSWIETHKSIDFSSNEITSSFIQHVYFAKDGRIYYYCVDASDNNRYNHYLNNGYDFSLGTLTSFSKIPVVGMDIANDDSSLFRGPPYLFPLVASCIKAAFAAAKIDYLIEFVLPPIMVHTGARMASIENADWRGINIGPTDKVEYLTYDGPILKSGEDQLARYSMDIRNQIPVNYYHSNTALEARLTDENSNMIKAFILGRFSTFCLEAGNLLIEYDLVKNINQSLFDVRYNYSPDTLESIVANDTETNDHYLRKPYNNYYAG